MINKLHRVLFKLMFPVVINQFNREGHLLVIKNRKTGKVVDSLQLILQPDNTVYVFYKGNVSVESKKLKDLGINL